MHKIINGETVPLSEKEKAEFEQIAADFEAQKVPLQWKAVREERNRKLQQSDWIVTKSLEIGETVPIEWLDYRQALRDITLQEDPYNIVWPEEP